MVRNSSQNEECLLSGNYLQGFKGEDSPRNLPTPFLFFFFFCWCQLVFNSYRKTLAFLCKESDFFQKPAVSHCDVDPIQVQRLPPQKNSSCQPNPCQNGGSCVDQGDGFVCVCPPSIGGKTCQGEDTVGNRSAWLCFSCYYFFLCLVVGRRGCLTCMSTGCQTLFLLLKAILLLPWTKRTILEIRGQKNAVPRVISCSIRRDQRRASPIRNCLRLLPCADRA